MTEREKINSIFELKNTGVSGFWAGNPHKDTWKIYLSQLNVNTRDEVFDLLNDDCRWFRADESYKHPENKPMFDVYCGQEKHSHGQAGFFSDCEDVRDVEKFNWPDVKYFDFKENIETISKYPNKMMFSGLSSVFFHVLCDFFGLENYFVKMYTDPDVVEAVTERVINFYEEANDLYFTQLGDKSDVFFFSNDFGSQLDVLISPEMFAKFVLPGVKRLVAVAKKHNKKVLLHSCGSIYKIIPMLIDAGIDALHPLQARAKNMDVKTLAQFKNDIAFVGGVDTQDLLVNGTPEEVKDNVRYIREILGENLVISPSHEALLSNVPFENVLAMAQAAKE